MGRLPSQGKTEGHAAQDGGPDQVCHAIFGFGQGNLLLQVEFQFLGVEDEEGISHQLGA